MNRRYLLSGIAGFLAMPALRARAQTTPDTLRFIPQANLTALDPIWTTATVTNNHGYAIFDTLYGADMAMQPQPQMVERHELSGDTLRWRFVLREGLTFHDGTAVRPADCIASVRRWCQRDSYGQLLASVVAAWEISGERSFDIRLTRPFPTMLDALAKVDGPAFVMPERLAVTDASKQVTEMVGSGPYRFVASEYNSGSRVVYAKFDAYRPRSEPPSRNAGGKVAVFPRVEWQIVPDPATAAAALQSGEIDWWERPLPDLRPMLARTGDVTQEVLDNSGRTAIMRLNHLQPPFDDVRVRRAVLMAVNQAEYMAATQGNDKAAWQECRNLWGKGTPYYTGEQTDVMPADPARAAAALKVSGYTGQPVVILNPTDFPDIGPLGEVTADLLRQIGMNVQLVETDWGTVVQRRTSREPVEKGGWSIFHTTAGVTGWSNPAVSLAVGGQGTKGWFGWWTNDKAVALAQTWLFAPSPAEQRDAAVALGRLALEEVATIPLGQFTLRTAYRRRLAGMLPGSAPYFWGVRPS